LLFAALLLGARVHSAEKKLSYQRVDVRMTLNKDASIDVVETQQVLLNGDWNGLYRDYSLHGCDDIEIISVRENEHEYKRGSVEEKRGYTVERKPGAVHVKWRSRDRGAPPYRNEETTFHVRYRITGAISRRWGRDALHWIPIMNERPGTFGHVLVTLELPEPSGQTEVSFSTEAPDAEWQIDPDDRRLIQFSASNVQPGNGFEIEVSLPKGSLELESTFRERILILLLVLFVLSL
jgi:hypothetical protein